MSQQSPDQFFQSAGINQFQPGQGPAQYGQAAYQAAQANPAAAAIAQAQGPNYGATNALANTLGAQAAGAGPSAAQAQLANATGATLGNLAGSAAATGPNNMAARQGLLNAGASALAAGGNASAQTRAQEAQSAQGQLSGLLANQTAQQQALALGNAGMANTGNMFNAGQSNAVGLANAAAGNSALAMGSQFANSNFQEGQQLSALSQDQQNQMRYQIQSSNNQATSPGAIIGDVGQGLGAVASVVGSFAKEGGIFVDSPTKMDLHNKVVLPVGNPERTAEKLRTPAAELRPDQKPQGGIPLSKELAPVIKRALAAVADKPLHHVVGQNPNGTFKVKLANGGMVDVHPAGLPEYCNGGMPQFSEGGGESFINQEGEAPTAAPDPGTAMAALTPTAAAPAAAPAAAAAPAGGGAAGAAGALGGLAKNLSGLGAGMTPNYGSAPGAQHFQLQHFAKGGEGQEEGIVGEAGPEIVLDVPKFDQGGQTIPVTQQNSDPGAQPGDQAAQTIEQTAGPGDASDTQGALDRAVQTENQPTGSVLADTAGATVTGEPSSKQVGARAASSTTQDPNSIGAQFEQLAKWGRNSQEIAENTSKAQVAAASGDATAAQALQDRNDAIFKAKDLFTQDTVSRLGKIYDQIGQGVHQMTPREYFNKQDTWGKVMTGIAMAAGTISQGTAGMMMHPQDAQAARNAATNPALDYIKKAISDDVQNQKTNLEMRGRQAEGIKSIYGIASQHFDDASHAAQASYLVALKMAEASMNKALAQQLPDQARNNILMTQMQTKQEIQTQAAALANSRVQAATGAFQLQRAKIGAQREDLGWNAQTKLMAGQDIGNLSDAEKGSYLHQALTEGRYVPSTQAVYNRKLTDKENEQLAANQNVQAGLSRLSALSKQGLSPQQWAQATSESTGLDDLYKVAMGTTGQFNQRTADLMREIISSPDTAKSLFTGGGVYKGQAKALKNQLETAASHVGGGVQFRLGKPQGQSDWSQVQEVATVNYALDEEGNLVHSPTGSESEDLAGKGWTPLTDEEAQQHQLDQKYGGIGGTAEAGALGVARGLTLGGSDVAAKALGAGETVEGLKEAHPFASGVGDILGSAPLVAGATALAGPEAGLGVRMAAQAGAGSLLAAGHDVSEAALGDPQLTAERVVAHLGLGAILGAGSEGVLSGLGWAGTKATDKLGTVIADAKAKLMASTSGELQKTAAKASQGFTDALQDVNDQADQSLRDFWPQHKAEMRAALTDVDGAPAKILSGDLLGQAKAKIAEMEADPAKYSNTTILGRFRKQVESFESDLRDLGTGENNQIQNGNAADYQEAVTDFRQGIDKNLPWKTLRTIRRTDPFSADTIDAIHDVRSLASDTAGNDQVFGRAGQLYKDFNATYSAREQALSNNVDGGLLRFFGNKYGNIDAGKVGTYVRKVASGAIGSDERTGALQNYLDATDGLNRKIQERIASGGLNPIEDMGEALEKLQAAKGTAVDATSAAINGVRGGQEGLGALVGGAVGTAAHMMGLGPLAPVAGMAVGALAGSRSFPYRAVQVLGALEKINSFASQALRTSAKDAVEGTSESAGAERMAAKADDGLRGISFTGEGAPAGESREAGVARISGQLQGLQADPAAIPDRLTAAMRHLEDHAPTIAASMKNIGFAAANFLGSKMPKDPFNGATVVASDWKPTPSQAREAEHYLMGTHHPFRTIQRVNEGTATPQEVEALNAVYPALAADHKGAISARLIKHPEKLQDMTHQHKTRLTAYLGRPVDRTNLPMTAQPATMPVAAPQPTSRAKPLRSTLSIANRSRLSTDRGD